MPSSHPHDWLRFAEQLLDAPHEDAGWRTAASRAYYAALHTVDATFPDVPAPAGVRAEGSHERIIRKALAHGRSGGPGKDEAIAVAHTLGRMKSDRTRADYNLRVVLTKEDANHMIRRANMIFQSCSGVKKLLA